MELGWYPNGKGSGKSSGQSIMYSIVNQTVFSIKNQSKFGAGFNKIQSFFFCPIHLQSLTNIGFRWCPIPFQFLSRLHQSEGFPVVFQVFFNRFSNSIFITFPLILSSTTPILGTNLVTMSEYSIQPGAEKRGRKRVFWGRTQFHCHKGIKRGWS